MLRKFSAALRTTLDLKVPDVSSSHNWNSIREQLQPAPDAGAETTRPAEPAPRTASKPEKPFKSAMGEMRRVLAVVAFFSLIINLLMLVGPIYMMQVYDRVLTSGSIPTLIYLTLAAGALIFVSALLEGARSRILVRLGGRFDELLSGQLFTSLFERDTNKNEGQESNLRDLDQLRGFLTGSGLFFFFDAPWTPIFLAVIFALHPMLFLVAACGAMALLVLALASEVFTRKPLGEATGRLAQAAKFESNVTTNKDTVEAMGMMAGLRERWREQYRDGLYLQSKASDRAGILTSMTKFVRPMLQIAILGTGAYLALNQHISGGAMIAASVMMGRALAPVEGAIGNWRSFILARGAYGRIRDVLTAPKREKTSMPLPKPRGFLSVEKLIGGPPAVTKPIVRGVSFGLEAGEALAVIGPSASGKSTLARLLLGVWQPLSGAVRLDGVNTADWNRAELGPHVGYLSQNIELFDGTIAENIARFGEIDTNAIITAAERAGVHDMILRLPNGYDTRVGQGGVVLSGGQRQRIGLARAVYGTPSLVILDEPNSNLDAQGEAALISALEDLKSRGTTILVVAHRASIVDVVDKILILRDGMISQFGPRDEVLGQLNRAAAQARAPQAQKSQTELSGKPKQETLGAPEAKSA